MFLHFVVCDVKLRAEQFKPATLWQSTIQIKWKTGHELACKSSSSKNYLIELIRNWMKGMLDDGRTRRPAMSRSWSPSPSPSPSSLTQRIKVIVTITINITPTAISAWQLSLLSNLPPSSLPQRISLHYWKCFDPWLETTESSSPSSSWSSLSTC